MHARTRELLDELHLPIDPDALAESLSAAHRQLLQVARALAFECRVLVLDEPTTALTDAEVGSPVRASCARCRREGTTLLYVSHRLPEVFRLCDRITVLRDGRLCRRPFDREAVQPEAIVRAMVGRDAARRDRPRVSAPGTTAPPALALATPVAPAVLRRRVARGRPGEIVGLFGLVGRAGPSCSRPSSACTADGRRDRDRRRGDRAARSPREAARAGVALVPEERQRQGLFFNLESAHNLVLPRADHAAATARFARARSGAMREAAARATGGSRRRASTHARTA